MTVFLVVLHVTVSIALIAVVLLQSGRGAEMGATFGAGGSQSVFGAGGGTSFISKVTAGAAIIFMLTSLTLAYFSGKPEASSVMKSRAAKPAPQSAPAQQQPVPAAPQEPAKK